jgi:hypothetical protein
MGLVSKLKTFAFLPFPTLKLKKRGTKTNSCISLIDAYILQRKNKRPKYTLSKSLFETAYIVYALQSPNAEGNIITHKHK